MKQKFTRLAPTAGVGEIKRILVESPNADIIVVDAEGPQMGMVGFADLKDAAFDAGLERLLYADDLLHHGPGTLRAGDDLATALRLVDTCGVDRLPVVTDDEASRVIGVVHRAETLKAQGDALQAAWRESQGSS